MAKFRKIHNWKKGLSSKGKLKQQKEFKNEKQIFSHIETFRFQRFKIKSKLSYKTKFQDSNTSKPVYFEQKQIHAWLCTLKKMN